MLNIKKYANGRFFNIDEKKYIKPEKLAEMIEKGEKIKVTLTKTGKDITDKVIAQFAKKEGKKKTKEKTEHPFLKTDKLVKWVGEMIDSKIEKVMDLVKLPSRDQVAKLDKNIQELNKKIDALKLSQEKATKKKPAASKKKAAKPATPAEPAATPKTDDKLFAEKKDEAPKA